MAANIASCWQQAQTRWRLRGRLHGEAFRGARCPALPRPLAAASAPPAPGAQPPQQEQQQPGSQPRAQRTRGQRRRDERAAALAASPPGAAFIRPKDLLASLQHARSADDVTRLLQHHAATVNAIHVGAAFARLRRLVAAAPQRPAARRRVTAFLATMVGSWSAESLASFQPRHLVAVLRGLAALGAAPEGPGMAALLHACLAVGPAPPGPAAAAAAIDLRELLLAVGDYAALREQLQPWLGRYLAQQAAGGQLARWEASHWTLALRAAARTRAAVPPEFWQGLWQHTGGRLQRWDGEQLAYLMWGLGALCGPPPAGAAAAAAARAASGEQPATAAGGPQLAPASAAAAAAASVPPEPWMGAWFRASAPHLSSWASPHMGVAFHSLARLRPLGRAAPWVRPPARWLQRCYDVLYWTPDQLPGAELAVVVGALAVLAPEGAKPPAELMDRLLAYGALQLQRGGAQQQPEGADADAAPLPDGAGPGAAQQPAAWACHLLIGLAKLQYRPDSDLLERWLAAVWGGLWGLTGDQLVLLLWALERLQERVPPDAVTELLQRLEAARGQLPPHLLLLSVYALGQLGVAPPGHWLARHVAAAEAALPAANQRGVCALVVGCALLHVQPSASLAAALRGAITRYGPTLPPGPCVRVACSLVALQQAPGDALLRALCERVEVLESRQAISPSAVARFEQAAAQLAALEAGGGAPAGR